MLKLQNVSKMYGKGEAAMYALNNISLEIQQGEFIGVLGASGSGKTTLLNIIGAIIQPTEGSCWMDGRNFSNISERAMSQLRADNFGYVTQSFSLIDELSVYENVILPLKYSSKRKCKKHDLVYDALSKIGLKDKAHLYPKYLSGGQQQRVAIARAIVNSPKIILADEPTGALDSNTGNEVMNVLKELNNQGKTIVMVTHDERYLKYFARTIKLADGKMIK